MGEIIKKQDHRREFIETLAEIARKDDRVVLLYPDVGFNYLEDFAKEFPTRCINTGVTEQATIMIATGMALSGLKPYVYSMINFVLFRPYEMVRNGVVNHHADVKLLGVKGGPSYKFLGFSHNLISDTEDVEACMTLGLTAHVPNSNETVRSVIERTFADGQGCYIRL